jgi:lipoate-protein ligase A
MAPPLPTTPDRSASGPAAPDGWVAEELRAHEELLRRGEPAARVGVVRGRALSFGVGVPADAPYLLKAREHGVATVARSTGGSGVLHLPGDLLWVLVLPREDPRVGRDFVQAYERLGRAAVAGLAALGARARWAPAPGLVQEYCTLSSRGKVLASGGRILGGAAQHATSSALLHHGFVSWTVDRPEVERLFGLPAEGPAQRLGGLEELGLEAGPSEAGEALSQALDRELDG